MPSAELRAASAFSFLRGSSLPEELVHRAAELGIGAVALVDRDGLSGAPRFFKAARRAGIRPLVGAELTLAGGGAPGSAAAPDWVAHWSPRSLVSPTRSCPLCSTSAS